MDKNKKGFTLIELLITCAIIAIMVSVYFVMVNKQTNQATKEVEMAAREIAAAIREAQNYALSGKVLEQDELLCATEFRTNVGTSDYSLRYDLVNPGTGVCHYNSYNKIYYQKTLSNDVKVDSASWSGPASHFSPGKINFKVPHAKVINKHGDDVSIASGSRISIRVMKNGISRYICVYSEGRVAESTAPC